MVQAWPSAVAPATRVYLRPLTAASGGAGGVGLAGGTVCFDKVELIVKPPGGGIHRRAARLEEIEVWAEGEAAVRVAVRLWLERLRRRPKPVLGLDFGRPLLMGIINVTPDSFSDGGDHLPPEAALRRAQAMIEDGADLVDLGAESTRPGAADVPAELQLNRLLPVLRGLAGTKVPISIDTRSATVMRETLAAGAGLINDVSGLRHDPEALGVMVQAKVPVVLMHSRGTPATMQGEARYGDVLTEVYDALEERIRQLVEAGIAEEKIFVDPGFGFAKTAAHNVSLLSGLVLLHGLGRPLLVGLSRKSYIARLSRSEAPKARLPGSLAAALWAVGQGAQVLRVHDVAETRQALAIWQQLVTAAAST
ncbi:MAG TPA: dihydropteroate synthase [Alphaproteobacteria bacterium]|nr:dihydropteroate synthase [Alphaproteobacteria bacterium]